MKNFWAVLLLLACSISAFAGEPIVIQKQGVFSSGGTVTEPLPGEFNVSENWLDFTRAGNTAHVDHANTFYQIPAGETKSPIVYLHGYGQSRTGLASNTRRPRGLERYFPETGTGGIPC